MRSALSVLLAGGLLVACSDAPDPTAFEVPVFESESPVVRDGRFGTPLSASEEVMPAGVVNTSRAVGQANFRLRFTGDQLDYDLKVANISNVFQAHIHRAAAGANGPIIVWLYPSTAPVAGPTGQGPIFGRIAKGTIVATDLVGPLVGQPLSALLDELRNGTAYVNVHTSDGVAPANTGPGDFPGGEIRGQIEHHGH
jgi:hypothetical protein